MGQNDWMKGGIVAVYKEEGISSHYVVGAIRLCTGERRVGHAGTLDPYAKGVLVIGVGREATRTLGTATGKEKEYVVRVLLGWRSTSDDREGQKMQVPVEQIPSEAEVREALARFLGTTSQRPPAFSAVKVKGRRAYKLARARKPPNLAPRHVEAKEIELLVYTWPHVEVRLVTGPGYYVRSFARDLGEALHTGGYVETLERTRVGEYTKEQALRLSDLPRRRPNN
jgi:tRNA pseudouridine55 synthase